jgi:ubiquinone/menaquinone biosynthesis C-methylase UbiE
MAIKYMNYKIIYIILLLLIILYIIRLYYYRNGFIEYFEDKFQDHETHIEIYDKEFVDLYEIIYRDFSDIEHDIKIVSTKIIDNVKNEINILVAGCGVGKLTKYLKDKYQNVIGVDISELMLKKSQTLYPNIKFIRGNLSKENIFDKNKFSHIFIDERTLYYNKLNDIKKIINNIFYWTINKGFLIVPIYDPENLQVACRYYSSNYMDNKGNLHGFTYLNDFSHDCYYIRNDDNKDNFDYYDKVIFDTGDKRIKKTIFNIPSTEIIYDIILNSGFELYHKEEIRTQIVGGYELVIFRKKNTITTVEELQKK